MMENIIINDKNNKKLIYVISNPNSKIYTYNYENHQLFYIPNLKDFFKLSTNNKLVSKGVIYKVYLDLDTGHLHYFKDGVEDYNKFLEKNGINYLPYILKEEKEKENVLLRKRNILKKNGDKLLNIICSVVLALTINDLIFDISNLIKYSNLPGNLLKDYCPNITVSQIVDNINASNNLTEEEKEYLINTDFFNDIIPYINKTHLDFTLKYRLKDLEIISYSEEIIDGNSVVLGYYSYGNEIYVYDYSIDKLDEMHYNEYPFKSTLGHELSHLFMANYNYSFLVEGLASIVTDEYFDPMLSSYPYLKNRVKILIEIIGKEPIMECVYGDDDSLLIDSISKYLDSKEEVKDFLNLLKKVYTSNSVNYHKIDNYLFKMYYNKYGVPITDSEYMFCLYSNFYCEKGFINERIDGNGGYYTNNEYENFKIFYQYNSKNELTPCFYLNANAETDDLLEPDSKYNTEEYIMVINYKPNPTVDIIMLDAINNIVCYKDGDKEFLISIDEAEEKNIITSVYKYYKKAYTDSWQNLVSINIYNSKIYEFSNGVAYKMNKDLYELSKYPNLIENNNQYLTETRNNKLSLDKKN